MTLKFINNNFIFLCLQKRIFMYSSKLVDLISTFSTSELREFRDFVASPYYNKNEELILFYNYLKKIAPHFPAKKIARAYVYKQLFPAKEYNEKHLNYLMSFLLKLAERFVGLKQYEAIEQLKEYHTMSSFIDRGLEKHYEYTYKNASKKLDKLAFRNSDYYYQKYLLADTASQLFFKKKQRKFDQSLQQAADYFDLYYLANKLIYSCEMINRGNIISGSYDLKLLEEIKSYLSKNDHRDIPAVHVYHQILLMQVAENGDAHFKELKSLLKKYIDVFPLEERLQIFSHALNYSILQINRGNYKYIEESFNLYREGIDTKLLFENGFLSPWAYKNVIKAGLMLTKFDWVETFIKEHNELQPPNFRQNGLHYNLADLYYSKKEFDKAQFHLAQVEYTDIYINLDSKNLLMKIYFESNEIEVLLSAIAALKIFLKRNKVISEKVRNRYDNFIRVLSLIVKNDPKSKQDAKKLLEEQVFIAEKKWLTEMINTH